MTVTFWPGVGIVKVVAALPALANVPAGETVHPVKFWPSLVPALISITAPAARGVVPDGLPFIPRFAIVSVKLAGG
jgi:hypothetical protein